MSTNRIKVDDALGSAQSYIYAMKSIFEQVFEGGNKGSKDYCALHLLADSAIREIKEAHAVFDDLEAGNG